MKRIYRNAGIDEKDKILELISEVYDKKKAGKITAQWEWRFKNHPFITEEFHPFYVCEEKEKIVAMTAFIPITLIIGERYLTGGIPHETMAHPKHHGAGMWLMKKIGDVFPLMVGVGNAFAERIWGKFRKYDIHLCQLHLFSFPLSLGNIAYQKTGKSVFRLLPSLQYYYKMIQSKHDLEFVQINEFGEDYDSFFESARAGYNIIPRRNAKYLNWRYRDCPTEQYAIFIAKKNKKITGYTVIKVYTGEDGLKRLRVIEIFARYNDFETYSFMIDKSINMAIEYKADLFQFITMKTDPSLLKVLKSKKVFYLKSKVITKVIGNCEGFGIDHSFFAEESNWHTSYGDFDEDYI